MIRKCTLLRLRMNFVDDALLFQELVEARALVSVGSLVSHRFHRAPCLRL